jgi:flagellar capping protein FliD
MATPEEEIRDLKAKITKYNAKLRAATTKAGEDRYANILLESMKTLNLLLQHKRQQLEEAQAQAQAQAQQRQEEEEAQVQQQAQAQAQGE